MLRNFPKQHKLIKVIFFCLVLSVFTSCSYAQNMEEGSELLLDTENFVGEWIKVKRTYSSHIKSINLFINLPENHKLLAKARPYLRVFTPNGMLQEFPLQNLDDSYIFNQWILENTAYFELALYYCADTKEGLCLIKNIVFEVNLNGSLEPENINLSYDIPLIEY